MPANGPSRPSLLRPADVRRVGGAVSLSADGNTALIGAIHESGGGMGKAYVFVSTG